MKKKIGLIGFGCVGQGFYDLLCEKSFGCAEIHRIAVRDRNKKRNAPSGLFCYDAMNVTDDPEIDIIVEAIDDADVAFEIAKKAMENGKHVVSASKKMIAGYMKELMIIQKNTGCVLLYEAAVCGAIPVVRKIDELFRYERLHLLRGIFNGTSNYILTRLNNGKENYQSALLQAQNAGFAESDPASDVGAYDAMYKTVILAKHAFGIILRLQDVLRSGIENIDQRDIQFARSKGKRIRLVPHLFSENRRVGAFVLPQFVDQDDKLFHVNDEFNSLQVVSDFAGEQFYYGRGAGSYPTAFALFSDLRDAISSHGYNPGPADTGMSMIGDKEVVLEVYIRFRSSDIRRLPQLSQIREGIIEENFQVVIARLSLAELKELLPVINDDGGIVIYNGTKLVSSKRQEIVGSEEIAELNDVAVRC